MSASRVDPLHADLEVAVWHELECGAYTADLELWRSLAEEHGGPILDIGCGAGRVALELARQGHDVTALDLDPALVAELRRRAGELGVATVVADARTFELQRRFTLVLVPMQTIQLLDGPDERRQFFSCARAHLCDGGALAVAISETLELYDADAGAPLPLPDILERDGIVYCSQPTAIRLVDGGYALERRRERIGADGTREQATDRIRLARITAAELEAEALHAGLRPCGRHEIAETRDHVGSVVVMLGA